MRIRRHVRSNGRCNYCILGARSSSVLLSLIGFQRILPEPHFWQWGILPVARFSLIHSALGTVHLCPHWAHVILYASTTFSCVIFTSHSIIKLARVTYGFRRWSTLYTGLPFSSLLPVGITILESNHFFGDVVNLSM